MINCLHNTTQKCYRNRPLISVFLHFRYIKAKESLRPGMPVVSIELGSSSKSYDICCQIDTRKEKNKIVGDFNSRATAYKMGRCFTEVSVSITAFRQKMWKRGLPYSTTGSLESGMKEMNAAANHSSLFTGSFSKTLLCLSVLWRRGRRLVSRHTQLFSAWMVLHTFLRELVIFAADWLKKYHIA